MRKVSEPTKILFGLLVGAALGVTANMLFAPATGAPPSDAYLRVVWVADNIASPVGQVFLRILFTVVVPLVFCSITLGVASLGNLGSLGRIGKPTIAWFVVTTALAASIGIFLVNTFKPGAAVDRERAAEIRAQFQSAAQEKMKQAEEGTGFS